MSVVQECGRAEAVIQRAELVLRRGCTASRQRGRRPRSAASRATAATAQMTADDSGVLIARHTAFADKNAAALSGAGQTEAALDTHVARGAALTQTGAQRLDAIAAQTRATGQAAPTARTPAAQRVILTALRSQVAQAQDVVNTAKTQAAGLAGLVRALKYPLDRPGPAVPGDVPTAAGQKRGCCTAVVRNAFSGRANRVVYETARDVWLLAVLGALSRPECGHLLESDRRQWRIAAVKCILGVRRNSEHSSRR